MPGTVNFPAGLAAMLEVEAVTWGDVWKPLNSAIEHAKPLQLEFNVTGYEYNPNSEVITVHGLLDEDGEVHLGKDNFRANMARFLRGTPEC